MTSRTTDINCDRCGKYMHSLMPHDHIPDVNICGECQVKAMPAAVPKPVGITAIEKQIAILDGGFIERYHVKGQRKLMRQSVADHSWRMATIIFCLYSTADGDHVLTAGLVLAALFHDVSERVTGDMPANVKRHNPAIEQAMHEVSTAEEVRLGIRFNLNEDQQRVLGWADRYEGALHCWDEYEMGNQKIVPTLMRYFEYCMDKKYELADATLEANRLMLLTELTNRMNRMHYGHV